MTDASHSFLGRKVQRALLRFPKQLPVTFIKGKPYSEHDDFFRSHLRSFRSRQASQQLQQSAEGQQSICEGLRQAMAMAQGWTNSRRAISCKRCNRFNHAHCPSKGGLCRAVLTQRLSAQSSIAKLVEDRCLRCGVVSSEEGMQERQCLEETETSIALAVSHLPSCQQILQSWASRYICASLLPALTGMCCLLAAESDGSFSYALQ